jgi:purine nucleosidase
MKSLFVATICSLLLFVGHAQADPLIQPNDRLAFCGDGMTADLGYTVYVEDYLLACAQVPGLTTAQFGWSAQPLVDVAAFKPTVVTMLYTNGDAKTRADDERKLIEALKKLGVRAIVLGSPPCDFDADPAKASAGNQGLAALAQIDKDVAAKEGVVYADVFGATSAAMAKAHEKIGAGFAPDQLDVGYLVAYAFLKAMNVNPDLGSVTVNFTPDFHIDKVEGSPAEAVKLTGDQTLEGVTSQYTFFYPACPNGKPLPEPIEACVPFDDDLNRFTLKVTNLPSTAAKVYWNGDSHDYTKEELEKGVNLSDDIPRMFGTVQNVDGAVRDQMQSERIAGTARAQGKPDSKAEADDAAALPLARSRMTPEKYTIRIQPLAPPEKLPPGPVNVTFDTDMDGDYDDAVACTLLNDFMAQGECNIIACNVNTHDAGKSSGAVVKAIDTYYGHPDIPIGASYDKNEPVVGSGYTVAVHQHFDPAFPNDDQLPKGVDVYRKALAAAPDGSVVMCSVGWMANITDLLKSAPDAISPLSGPDLVKQKVRKLVIMANTNPNDVYVIKNWPTPILWSTDIGNYIYPGKTVVTTPDNNPLKFIFKVLKVDSRQGWDPTAVWLSVRGESDGVYEVATGGYWRVNVPPDQWGTWVNGPVTNHGMATVKMPSDQVLKLYNTELARVPKSAATAPVPTP